MPITVIKKEIEGDELLAPFVVCDHCAKPIYESGNVLWKKEAPTWLVFFHKDCGREYESLHGGRSEWQWAELSAWLFHLVHNSKIDLEQARHHSDLMIVMGLSATAPRPEEAKSD